MEKGTSLRPGWIVQLLNCEDVRYQSCFLTIDKVYLWGVSGYIYGPVSGSRAMDQVPPQEIKYRACWSEMEFVGKGVDLSEV
jgi:hypothetical protein